MLGTLKYVHVDSDTKSVQNTGSLSLILVELLLSKTEVKNLESFFIQPSIKHP